jgi:sodium transport system ATP-binding protein
MREVERLCDRIAIMHRGRIVAEGTLGSLLEEHEERDFEELFFRLIENADGLGQTAASHKS